jgi:hypothetical protein
LGNPIPNAEIWAPVCGIPLYIYNKRLAPIKRSELTAEYSPKDALLIFLKVMKISYEGFEWITEVPKKVRGLEENCR